jgi:glycerophosphoryl diester phosphodiesterase
MSTNVTQSASRSAWRQTHPTWIVGHRGAPRRARENTIESLDFAESFGVDAVEFDVRQTRDGEAVLFHDEDVVLGTQRIPVRSFTAREIEKLLIPSEFGEYRIPRLEQVFHRYGTALRYIVEVKPGPGMLAGTMARRVARLAAIFGVEECCPVARPAAGPPAPLFPPVDAIGPKRDLVSPTLLEQAAAAGLSVHPWTVDEADDIRRMLRSGVASITTNAPDVALEIRSGTEEHETGLAIPGAGEREG